MEQEHGDANIFIFQGGESMEQEHEDANIFRYKTRWMQQIYSSRKPERNCNHKLNYSSI